jgi:hypothetical protein
MSQKQSDSSKKRPHTPSYSQSFKDGDVPKAHSQEYESVLAEHGVYMEELTGRSLVGHASWALSRALLQGQYDEPEYTPYPLSKFLAVWQLAQSRNEFRIYRDITPLLVPSAEILHILGHDDLAHIREEISVEWTKANTLGGPKPKPDFAVGIARSAFSEEEITKLKNYTAFERPTFFAGNLYFPFLLCEAKCGNEAINRADRQNMHSSSIAVNAIVQLYRSVNESQASQLSGRVLVFSISHDNELVKLYGHFAIIEGGRITFYRFLIARIDIAPIAVDREESRGWKRTYDFVREIYHKFYPQHLQRIRDILGEMDDPRTRSMVSNMSIEESESQESSQFKLPNAPAGKRQKREIAFLQEQLAQQERVSKEQMVLLEKQMEKQMAQQEKQYKEQMAQQEKQMAQQEKQMAQQEKQMAQQEKQMAQQEKQMAQQEKQYKEQIEMLKQLLDRR